MSAPPLSSMKAAFMDIPRCGGSKEPPARSLSSHALFTENEQSPDFYGQTIVNNSKTKGHAGVTPHGLLRDCPPRPSRDSVSRRIVYGRHRLSSPPANYPQFRPARTVRQGANGSPRRERVRQSVSFS